MRNAIKPLLSWIVALVCKEKIAFWTRPLNQHIYKWVGVSATYTTSRVKRVEGIRTTHTGFSIISQTLYFSDVTVFKVITSDLPRQFN